MRVCDDEVKAEEHNCEAAGDGLFERGILQSGSGDAGVGV